MKAITFENSKNPGHYAPGMISRGMLYISGQLPVDPATGTLVAGDAAAQTRQALSNLERVLHAAGAEKENVVQCRVYVSDIGNWAAVNRVYAAFFGSHKPARAVVPTGALHYGALVEIEAVAELAEAQ